MGEANNAVPASSKSYSDKLITFSKPVINEGCCYAVSPRPQKGTVAPDISMTLRSEEEVIKACISDLQHRSVEELEEKLRER